MVFSMGQSASKTFSMRQEKSEASLIDWTHLMLFIGVKRPLRSFMEVKRSPSSSGYHRGLFIAHTRFQRQITFHLGLPKTEYFAAESSEVSSFTAGASETSYFTAGTLVANIFSKTVKNVLFDAFSEDIQRYYPGFFKTSFLRASKI